MEALPSPGSHQPLNARLRYWNFTHWILESQSWKEISVPTRPSHLSSCLSNSSKNSYQVFVFVQIFCQEHPSSVLLSNISVTKCSLPWKSSVRKFLLVLSWNLSPCISHPFSPALPFQRDKYNANLPSTWEWKMERQTSELSRSSPWPGEVLQPPSYSIPTGDHSLLYISSWASEVFPSCPRPSTMGGGATILSCLCYHHTSLSSTTPPARMIFPKLKTDWDRDLLIVLMIPLMVPP